MSSPDWPPLLLRREGRVVLRDGVTLVYYLRPNGALRDVDIRRAIEAFRFDVGGDALCHFVNEHGDCQPYSDQWLDDELEAVFDPATDATEVSLTLLSDDSGVPEFEVHFFALRENASGWADFRDYAYFWLPRAQLLELGPDRVFDLFARLASILPVVTGYASPALLYHHDVREATTRCFRWPGLDVLLTRTSAMEIGDLVPGTYWATALSASVAQRLGGALAIQSALGAMASVHGPESGTVFVRLGQWPKSGDRNSGLPLARAMPEYLAMAKLIAPITFEPKRNYFADADNNPDPDAMLKWHARFRGA